MWTYFARAEYAHPAKRHATNLTNAAFALVEPRLPPPSRLGRPHRRPASGAGGNLDRLRPAASGACWPTAS